MIEAYHKTPEQLEQEHELITNAQADPKDFEPLYNKYFEQIFRFVYQRMESKDDTADICSQVFFKALLNIKQFQHRKVPFSAWLYRIAVSEISNYYAQSKKSRAVNTDVHTLNELLDEINHDYKEERIDRVSLALKKISGDDLLLIEMRFFENRSFKEIADILAITENNAKVKLYRVIDKLKQQLL